MENMSALKGGLESPTTREKHPWVLKQHISTFQRKYVTFVGRVVSCEGSEIVLEDSMSKTRARPPLANHSPPSAQRTE